MGELFGKMLVERIGHMSVLVEDAEIHAMLLEDLTAHITATRG